MADHGAGTELYSGQLIGILELVWGEGWLSPGGPEEVASAIKGIEFNLEILDGGIDAGMRDCSGPTEMMNNSWLGLSFLENNTKRVGKEIFERDTIKRTFASTNFELRSDVGGDCITIFFSTLQVRTNLQKSTISSKAEIDSGA